MLNCYFLYNYSLRLETDHFKASPADYLFLLIFNWLCCLIIGIFFDLPVSVRCTNGWSIVNSTNLFSIAFIALDGSDDFVCAVHLVSAEQRCHREFLVRDTFQSNVSALGAARIQFNFVKWQHIFIGWHFGRSFVFLLENQISTRIGWNIVFGNSIVFVSQTLYLLVSNRLKLRHFLC